MKPTSSSSNHPVSEWKWYRRHRGIEPFFGHTKQDHRMIRNFLKSKVDDKVYATLPEAVST